MSTTQIFRIHKEAEYRKAGPTDLLELLPAPGNNPLFLVKWVVEVLVYAIAQNEFIHLSGPTGSAKSSLLEAMHLVPENFHAVSSALGLRQKPLKVFSVEMAVYEAPGELYQRRSLRDGTTYDELSGLVQSLQSAMERKQHFYPLIWLREMGRVHSSSVQGGLLNLMTKQDIVLADGRRLNGQGVAWIADSNYQAEHDSNHTLVTLDDALRRRFSVNLTLDYLTAEQEAHVLHYLVSANELHRIDVELINKLVKLGQLIRRQRLEGSLQSLVPPTIYGYLAFLRMAHFLNHLTLQQIAMASLLGNASLEDRKMAFSLFNEVFGLQAAPEEDPTMGGNLF